ncbi:MAG: 23S rRNA (adenine(2503)-C(2))-methyltransferase RlmN [Thermodesulfobacteriota bacterium]
MANLTGKINLKNLSWPELEKFVASWGEKPFRARQLARWLYGRGVESFAEMTDISKELREKLSEQGWISFLKPEKILTAADGTRKFLFALADGYKIESVLLMERDHLTLCLSTQVGCPLGCKFCLTGARGFKRNLESFEILDQILGVRATLSAPEKIRNLVFMGMGEPLLNFENVVRALEIVCSPQGLQFSHRRVTLSTAGIIPEMKKILSRKNFVKLAISLNATTEEQRSFLMPINRQYPLTELLQACRQISLPNREKITFEYVLLQGINDAPADALRLARLLKGLPAKINLIPFNEHPASPFKRPPDEAIQEFREILLAQRFTTVIRQSKGTDILAACGQLGGEGEVWRR